MSTGSRLTFNEGYYLAQEAFEHLRPTVVELQVVGSVRRRRTTVGDVELLARPHSSSDLLGAPATIHLQEVRAKLEGLGTWVKGGSRMMQITDLLGRPGTTLELFLVHPSGCKCADCPNGPAAWGSMLAIRTGPADLGRYCVTAMRARGFRHDHGFATRESTGEVVPTETEEDFFDLAGLKCLPPQLRDNQSRALWETHQQPQTRKD